jgi:hypothetical protein
MVWESTGIHVWPAASRDAVASALADGDGTATEAVWRRPEVAVNARVRPKPTAGNDAVNARVGLKSSVSPATGDAMNAVLALKAVVAGQTLVGANGRLARVAVWSGSSLSRNCPLSVQFSVSAPGSVAAATAERAGSDARNS